MKISDNFPVLQKTNSLFVVSGQQTAVIYQLRAGEINERDTIKVDNPSYSDREGRFEARGPHGRLQGSGTIYDSLSEDIKQKFLNDLEDGLKQVRRPYDSIYLFAPTYMLREITTALPSEITNKIKREFAGNFTKSHPTDLLQKVKDRRDSKAKTEARQRALGDAAKILRRGRRSFS